MKKAKDQTATNSMIDLKNPDTGDTIISSLVLGGIAIIGIIAITKNKRKEI